MCIKYVCISISWSPACSIETDDYNLALVSVTFDIPDYPALIKGQDGTRRECGPVDKVVW